MDASFDCRSGAAVSSSVPSWRTVAFQMTAPFLRRPPRGSRSVRPVPASLAAWRCAVGCALAPRAGSPIPASRQLWLGSAGRFRFGLHGLAAWLIELSSWFGDEGAAAVSIGFKGPARLSSVLVRSFAAYRTARLKASFASPVDNLMPGMFRMKHLMIGKII